MPISEKQRAHNKKYRDKQAKIKKLARELDALTTELEGLPKCELCRAHERRPGNGPVECLHEPARHKMNEKIQLVRAKLRDLDH